MKFNSTFQVPTRHKALLATPYGMLMNELCRSPGTVLRGVVGLLDQALAVDTGSVTDEDGDDFNTSTGIILYAARLGARVLNFVSFLIDHHEDVHECLRSSDVRAFYSGAFLYSTWMDH